MDQKNHFNRRNFIKISTAGAVGVLPLVSSANNLLFSNSKISQPKVYLFSKTLQFLDYEEMSEVVKEIGFDGIDLTVRPKGHVLPENAHKDLPKATEAMQKLGLRTDMISTNVIDPYNSESSKLLNIAKELGYSIYRTGWIKYSKNQPIQQNLIAYKKQLQDLAELNARIGITGAFQNHSGNYLGAPVWDLKEVLEGIAENNLGVQYDIMHATVEGAQSWQLGFELVKAHINSLVVKDFKWIEEKGKWKRVYTPLGEGMVDFDSYFKFLKKYKIEQPISLHFEYDLGRAEKGKIPIIDKEIIFANLKKDLLFFKNTWDRVVNSD